MWNLIILQTEYETASREMAHSLFPKRIKTLYSKSQSKTPHELPGNKVCNLLPDISNASIGIKSDGLEDTDNLNISPTKQFKRKGKWSHFLFKIQDFTKNLGNTLGGVILKPRNNHPTYKKKLISRPIVRVEEQRNIWKGRGHLVELGDMSIPAIYLPDDTPSNYATYQREIKKDNWKPIFPCTVQPSFDPNTTQGNQQPWWKCDEAPELYSDSDSIYSYQESNDKYGSHSFENNRQRNCMTQTEDLLNEKPKPHELWHDNFI
jgi:hypothetical protein